MVRAVSRAGAALFFVDKTNLVVSSGEASLSLEGLFQCCKASGVAF